jgi:hypothetical protein
MIVIIFVLIFSIISIPELFLHIPFQGIGDYINAIWVSKRKGKWKFHIFIVIYLLLTEPNDFHLCKQAVKLVDRYN